jgi:peptidoglycan/LPS O-acetylase OafA/YrhL
VGQYQNYRGIFSSGGSKLRYNPALDGVRALAVILVICNHQMQRIVPTAGWIGVDIFFALSGYLITSILLRELRRTGKISIGDFYRRRALRLTPALAVLASFELARSFFSHDGGSIREATFVGVSYIENWNMIYGWWPVGVMGPTWSLSVEEQFYLIWPLALILFVHRHPLEWIAVALIAMTIAELALWRGGGAGTEHTLQFSLGVRPVGLLIGAALPFLNATRWRLPAFAAPAALAAIVAYAFTADRSAAVFLSAPMGVSLAAAALIICTHQAGAITSTLSLPPIRYLGKISYGVYLYHVPIFYVGEQHKIHLPGYLYGIAILGLVFVTAALSYEFIEKPFLRLKDSAWAAPGYSSGRG